MSGIIKRPESEESDVMGVYFKSMSEMYSGACQQKALKVYSEANRHPVKSLKNR